MQKGASIYSKYLEGFFGTLGEGAQSVQKGSSICWKCLEGTSATFREVAQGMQKGAVICCKCLEGSLSLLEKSRRESEKWLRFVGIPCMLFLTPFESSRKASKRGRRGVVATVSRSVDPAPWTWWRGAGPVCVRGAAVARSVDPVPWTWWRGVLATVSRSVDPVPWTGRRGAGPVH